MFVTRSIHTLATTAALAVALVSVPALADDPDLPWWGGDGMTVSLGWDFDDPNNPGQPNVAITPYYYAEYATKVETHDDMEYKEGEDAYGIDAGEGEQKGGKLTIKISNTFITATTKYVTVKYDVLTEGDVSVGVGVGSQKNPSTEWKKTEEEDLGNGWTRKTVYSKIKPQPEEEEVRLVAHVAGKGKVRFKNIDVTTHCPDPEYDEDSYYCYDFGSDIWPPEPPFEWVPEWSEGAAWDRYGSYAPSWMPMQSVKEGEIGVMGLPGGFPADGVLSVRIDDLAQPESVKHVACQFDLYTAEGGLIVCEPETSPGTTIENYTEEFQDVGNGWQRCLITFDVVPAPDWEEFRWVMFTDPGSGPVAVDNVALSATNRLPDEWMDGFDIYEPGAGLHGQYGWKGWDNDPAFDAFVTDDQAYESCLAVDVAGDTDIVREFEEFSSGQYICTAWQYIPSDFQSGGSGQFAGSYFIMLNTYVDGGPHEDSDWSVQMQFDSNDGMLKVYHGNGLNTIDVPYVPDEWVEIQVAIDLDEDWTQIYYDDALIAEYSWTGGVLGEGGGALNIGAVDLFANGSTSIYYDDVWLRPKPTLGDVNCDGVADFDDINPFVLALTDVHAYMELYPACVMNADINGDGGIDFDDINPFVALLSGG